ncbi:MAG: rhomboid family intramembrane serine protease [Planctomycetaceae bacterium]
MKFIKTFLHVLRQSCRHFPTTMLCAAVCLGLGLAVYAYEWKNGKSQQDAQRILGSVSALTYSHLGEKSPAADELPSGPFDVWEGDWWRIPVCAFHHGNWWHLTMNLLSLWFLGALLEPRCSRVSYLLLILGSATLTMLLQFLNGDYAVGISGTICAQLGALLVMRRKFPELNEILTPQFIAISMLMLLSGLFMNQIPEVIEQGVGIANLAHFSGLAYGWLFGAVYGLPLLHPRLTRTFFWTMHLFFWPAMTYVVTPIFNADFHWYQGYLSDRKPERLMHYQTAVQLDPGRMVFRRFLALSYRDAGDFHSAWKTSLEGLRHHRLDDNGLKLAQHLWKMEYFRWRESRRQKQRDFRRKKLAIALHEVENVFGDESSYWVARLRLNGVSEIGGHTVLVEPDASPRAANALAFELDTQRPLAKVRGSFTAAGYPNSVQHSKPLPDVDVEDPESALEGVLL